MFCETRETKGDSRFFLWMSAKLFDKCLRLQINLHFEDTKIYENL